MRIKIVKLTTCLILLILLTLSVQQSCPAAPAETPLEMAFILFILEENAQTVSVRAQALIEHAGGQVIHTFPYQAMIVKAPTAAIQQLSNWPAVAAVFTQPVELSTMDVYGPGPRYLAGLWNELVTLQPVALQDPLLAQQDPGEPEDLLVAPDLPSPAELWKLKDSATLDYYQTSEYMAGSVAVGIILVESNGAVDPSSENWTEDEKGRVLSEIVAALDWWAALEPRANLSFVYDDHTANPLPTGVEPITRPSLDQQYWINDAMAALGYGAASYFTKVRDYNNVIRNKYQTDWAFTIFVVDSSQDYDKRFTDKYFAYAYLGGPFMVMTYGNNGYGPTHLDAVAAHEIGHIFRALDQYSNASQPCTRRSGYLDIENQNSQYGSCASNEASIMRGQIFPYLAKVIDPYAAGQLGWRDSDQDGILDPLDTELSVAITTVVQEGNIVNISGFAEITPYPSPIQPGITINKLNSVKYRFGEEEWQPVTAMDGQFDASTEAYQFAVGPLSPGRYRLQVTATDSAGNISAIPATRTFTILDPIDDGLNTELYIPDTSLFAAPSTVAMSGLSYDLPGQPIIRVEYRLNQGPWQPAIPQDGAFNSDTEPFTISLDLPGPETYLLEAFATGLNGRQEINLARQEIEVIGATQAVSTFLPIISTR